MALSFSLSGVAYAASIGSADIIDNSVRSIDLKDGAAVKGIDVVDNNLTGADIDEASLNGVARKLFYIGAPSTLPAPITTLATVGGYTLAAQCIDADASINVTLVLLIQGPFGKGQGDSTQYVQAGSYVLGPSATTFDVPAGRQIGILVLSSDGPTYSQKTATYFIQSGTTLLELELYGFVDHRVGVLDRCLLYGAATPLV
jgi:hypothetical protein